MADLPFFIPFRDQISYLRQLVGWLRSHGLPSTSIHIVDMDSTYHEALDQLREWEKEGVVVDWLGENRGAWSLFRDGIISKVLGHRGVQQFYVSDPDVVPDPQCREDILEHLQELLVTHRSYRKIGLGLRTDDIPDSYKMKKDVVGWEAKIAPANRTRGDLINASTATTFAIYREFSPTPWKQNPQARTTSPDIARHLPWYETDPKALPPDILHYYEHAPHRHGRGAGWGWNPWGHHGS